VWLLLLEEPKSPPAQHKPFKTQLHYSIRKTGFNIMLEAKFKQQLGTYLQKLSLIRLKINCLSTNVLQKQKELLSLAREIYRDESANITLSVNEKFKAGRAPTNGDGSTRASARVRFAWQSDGHEFNLLLLAIIASGWSPIQSALLANAWAKFKGAWTQIKLWGVTFPSLCHNCPGRCASRQP